MDELIKIYDEYIELLNDEIDSLIGLHIAHGGYKSSPKAVLKGLELREKIKLLKEKQVTTMYQLFSVGDRIGGFCNGYFGRDDYLNKTCVKVRPKYALFEYEGGEAVILNISDIEGLEPERIKEWQWES